MSLRRKSRKGSYVTGYLRSGAWRARRARFLEGVVQRLGAIICPGCDEELSDRTADVHHLSYEGVSKTDAGVWVAAEGDEDLLAMCRWCHERLHALMDRDRGWSGKPRREATLAIIQVVRRELAQQRVRGGRK